MSRSDQWIGSTEKCEKWWDRHVPGHKMVPIGYYAFNVPNRIFGREVSYGPFTYREHIQASPWSSGPMYFTNVEISKDGNVIGYMFNWKLKERNHMTEYVDAKKGEYYV